MNVALVHPPTHAIPGPLPPGMAQLAAVLRRAGVDVRVIDLARRAADAFLTDSRVRHDFGLACERVIRLFQQGDRPGADRVTQYLELMEPRIVAAPRARSALLDPIEFFDAEAFRRSFWTAVDALSFFHQLEAVITPERPRFARDLVAYAAVDSWTPLRDQYEHGMIDDVLETQPALVVVHVAHASQAAEAGRIARRLRACSPRVHLCASGELVAAFEAHWLEGGRIFELFDSVHLGTGAQSLERLAAALSENASLAGIPNLVWRDGAGPRVTEVVPGAPGTLELELCGIHRSAYAPEPVLSLDGGVMDAMAASPAFREELAAGLARANQSGARHMQIGRLSLESARWFARLVASEGIALCWSAEVALELAWRDPAIRRELHAGGCRLLVLGDGVGDTRFVAECSAELFESGIACASNAIAAPYRSCGAALLHAAHGGKGLGVCATRPLGLESIALVPALADPSEDGVPRAAPAEPRRCFRDEDFGFRARLEAHWRDVRDEWNALPRTLLRPWPESGSYAGTWDLFGFHGAGRTLTTRAQCPRTSELLDSIPGLYTAAFSVVGPRSSLPLHWGEGAHVLRCHLGIAIPPGSGLRVGGEERVLAEGRTLVFEDTLLHRAWNPGEQPKVVLLLDFWKPRAELAHVADPAAQQRRDEAYFVDRFPGWMPR